MGLAHSYTIGRLSFRADVTGRKSNKLPVFSYAFVMSLTLNLIIELNNPALA
jgi:hypothetical protein